MKIAIVGFDTEGTVSYEYFKAQGADITICDQNTELIVPEGVEAQLGEGYLDNLDRFDRIVRTPGLHPAKILAKNPGITNKITSQTNIFFEMSPTSNVIGVTGTKGKGTTSSLITKMLETAGKSVYLGGNIGVPPLTFLGELTGDAWVVLELSSFQLIDLKHSPHIAVCLMVEPEHLDWHEDFEEYIAAKQQLFIHQNSDDVAIYYAKNDNSLSIADASEGKLLPYYEKPGAVVTNNEINIDNNVICQTNELQLLGEHNWQNACAATTAVWQVTQDIAAMKSALTHFSGLEHRLEFVREINEVKYYDDSFGTTPATAIVAINAFEQPKVVILGGSDKGVTFENLAKAVKENNVRTVITIGERGQVIADELRKAGYTSIVEGGSTMAEIVQTAKNIATPGDVVLLSTACASFDMFKNYKDRGDQFKQVVQALV
jgi:UDP-N-acetylmuramoylalanine--D-glutamate ligase